MYWNNLMKPVVEYVGEADFHNHAGNPAWPVASVYGINHPFLGTQLIRTSKIVKKHDNGDFETLNTLYRKTI